jgi:hypothetical protein
VCSEFQVGASRGYLKNETEKTTFCDCFMRCKDWVLLVLATLLSSNFCERNLLVEGNPNQPASS